MTERPVQAEIVLELQLELARLKQQFNLAREDAGRLRGLWPRAELQRLRVDLASESAARARLSADHEALRRLQAQTAALNGSRLVRWARLIARPFRPVRRGWRLAIRLAGLARQLPKRLALRRQMKADRAVIASSGLFDTAFYGSQAGGGAIADPIGHYLWLGYAAGHAPHPLFDGAWYEARHPAPDGANPFAAFARGGVAADEDPHPLFDTAFYLAQAPEAQGRALLHYTSLPAGDLRSPLPMFDPACYPEGLGHWVRSGAAADLDPHPLFATGWYRRTQMAGAPAMNPLVHWRQEGRPPNPFGLRPGVTLGLPGLGANPAASLIVRAGRTAIDTARTLMSIAQNSGGQPFEVILVERDASPARPDGVRTAAGVGAAVTMASGRHFVVLGGGVIVHAGWLSALLETADAAPGAGLVGGKVLAADGSLLSAGVCVREDGRLCHDGAGDDPSQPRHAFARQVSAVHPAVMLIRRDAWAGARGFDDGYASGEMAACDLAFTLRASGWIALVQPECVVTSPYADDLVLGDDADRARFAARWAATLSSTRPLARMVLVLADACPVPGEGAVSRALDHLLEAGRRVALHPLEPEISASGAAVWERRGIEIIRAPAVFEAWLAASGGSIGEIWSFRAAAAVPAAALLRETGAAILHWEPIGPLPAWCDAALPAGQFA